MRSSASVWGPRSKSLFLDHGVAPRSPSWGRCSARCSARRRGFSLFLLAQPGRRPCLSALRGASTLPLVLVTPPRRDFLLGTRCRAVLRPPLPPRRSQVTATATAIVLAWSRCRGARPWAKGIKCWQAASDRRGDPSSTCPPSPSRSTDLLERPSWWCSTYGQQILDLAVLSSGEAVDSVCSSG